VVRAFFEMIEVTGVDRREHTPAGDAVVASVRTRLVID